jgi:hypothetical protein
MVKSRIVVNLLQVNVDVDDSVRPSATKQVAPLPHMAWQAEAIIKTQKNMMKSVIIQRFEKKSF